MIYSAPKNVDEATDLLSDLETMSNREYAKKVGVNESSVRYWRSRCEKILNELSGSEYIKGTSTMYGPDGEVKAQWVKTDIDKERSLKAFKAAAEELKRDIKPQEPIKYTGQPDEDLLACYILTDYHLGMLSEGDWDIDKAEAVLIGWIDAAIEATPDADTALFAQLGDFFHYDSMEAVTPRNRHLLDAACRADTMVRTGIRLLRYVIDRLLKKHKHVHVIMASANHDPYSSVWLRSMFSVLYENEPRISVDDSEDVYYAYEWGLTSLFFHHGHKRGVTDVPKTFARQFRDIYGRTEFSYGHIGHFHHSLKLPQDLMTIEIQPTLTARDAYAKDGGWFNDRRANTIIYSKKHGEVGRISITPGMVSQCGI